MWETNKYERAFQEIHEVAVKKESSSGRLFVFNREGSKKSPLAEMSFFDFLKKEYANLLLLFVGIFLIELMVYNSYIFMASAICCEMLFFYLNRKHQVCVRHIKNIFFWFRFFIAIEVLLLFMYFFYGEPILFLRSSALIASLFLFNFYLYIRLYFYALKIKFNKIYQMIDHVGFYVWRGKC